MFITFTLTTNSLILQTTTDFNYPVHNMNSTKKACSKSK